MKMAARSNAGDVVDVLILHGMSKNIVDYLKDLIGSLGLRAATVLDLPSHKKPQEQRVDYYIKDCLIPLVLVTFDESEKNTTKARPNVYDEMARCRQFKRSDTLVLQEMREGRLVELPSNVLGQLVTVQFDAALLHNLVPPLLTELRGRGLLLGALTRRGAGENGGLLGDFLERMDQLWEKEFDEAWDNLHRLDYDAERELALALDHFFQQYHSVFRALIQEQCPAHELQSLCAAAYAQALQWAARAWEHAADAKMIKADTLHKQIGQSGRRSKHHKPYNDAANQLRKAKKAAEEKDKIAGFKKAIHLVNRYMETENGI
ncbi:hypothetical protein KGQ27_03770 [Patescibacteria group bacterium]|nr:hypothetical protein [Patescibacteria group bacterium]